MGIDWTHQLAEQLDRRWRQQLRPRYDGLTDTEYFWEPVASTWNIRPRGHGRAAITAGGGDFIIDYAYPEPTPAPVTTIAWRLAHLIVSVFGTRVADHFGGPPVDDLAFDYAGPQHRHSGSSMTCTRHGWPASRASVRPGSPGRAALPKAPSPSTPWPRSCCTSTARRCTTAPRSPCSATCTPTAYRSRADRRLGGSIYSCPASGDRTATGKSPEQRQKSTFAIRLIIFNVAAVAGCVVVLNSKPANALDDKAEATVNRRRQLRQNREVLRA